MTRYGMVINLDKCVGCYICQLACKDEHVNNPWPPYSEAQPEMGHFWMRVVEKERGKVPWVKLSHLPIPCMHCDNPPCLKDAPSEAGYKRPDGIVIFDPVKSRGQRSMMKNCPYGAVYWNDDLAIPQKCTFCVHLLERGWKQPRCADSCPAHAIIFGDLEDPNSEVYKLVKSGVAKPLRPELGTKPRVFYIGLDKVIKPFLAGSVVDKDKDECLEGATVTLKDVEKGVELKTKTNVFGDFEFTALEKDKKYVLEIEAPGFEPFKTEVVVKDDIYLGDIFLKRLRE